MRLPLFSCLRWLSAGCLIVTLLLGCQKNDDSVAQPRTAADLIQEDNQFSILRAIVTQTGLGDALKGANLTLFAPTDSAFQASGITTPVAITSLGKEQVRTILLYHVLPGIVRSTDAQIPANGFAGVLTTSGKTANVIRLYNALHFNNATITRADQTVANGVVHAVDRIVLPATGNLLTTIQSNPNLTFLSAAIKRVGSTNPTLTAALSSTVTSTTFVTVYAPSDDAFRASTNYKTLAAIETANPQELARVLAYHVSEGLNYAWWLRSASALGTSTWQTLLGTSRTVGANGATITVKGTKNATAATIKQADLPATNGIVHIIDQVLQP